MIVRVRAMFEAWSRDWSSSSPVRGLLMGFKDFGPSWKLVDRIVGVRAQFEAWSHDCMSSSPVRGLE